MALGKFDVFLALGDASKYPRRYFLDRGSVQASLALKHHSHTGSGSFGRGGSPSQTASPKIPTKDCLLTLIEGSNRESDVSLSLLEMQT
jgi:hypothetical protein